MLSILKTLNICFFYNKKKFSKMMYLRYIGLSYKFAIDFIAIDYFYLIINKHTSMAMFLLEYLFSVYKNQDYIL